MEKRISEGFCKTQKVLKRFLFLISLICSLSTISLDVFAYESIFEQNYTLSLSFQNARDGANTRCYIEAVRNQVSL